MTHIELAGVTVEQDGHRLLGELSLSVGSGERLVILGPSGCGKTTLLRVIAGVQPITDGRIVLDDLDVTQAAPGERNVAMVDQQASLQPHLDVRRNLGFALRLRRTPPDQIRERVAAQTRAFSLGSLLPRRPRTLSGGERHEVALARSLVRRASVLLMDEPMARVDPGRQGQLLRELIDMQEGYGVTLIAATNDQRVAMRLAHRIAVLVDGQLAQVGTPSALYARPSTLFVAGFLGSPPMNLLDGMISRTDGRPHVRAEPFSLPTWVPDLSARVGEPVVLGVRPQQVEIDTTPGRASERCRVVRRAFGGAEVTLHLRTPAGRELTAVVATPGPEVDTLVGVSAEPSAVHLFDTITELAIAHGV